MKCIALHYVVDDDYNAVLDDISGPFDSFGDAKEFLDQFGVVEIDNTDHDDLLGDRLTPAVLMAQIDDDDNPVRLFPVYDISYPNLH